ncbi:NUDIX hydrolase [Nonomuraea insulae]|uniref:NUDIX hydrolase n=1 Tax=Nonomuraea insulae TaxID=1616787 RepID=A0ABW1CPM3_9ACTN
MSESEDRFFATVAARQLVRASVRAIVIDGDRVLLQRPADATPEHHYGFIGGEYEVGDTFESRLRQEIDEETNARLLYWEYLLVAENRFVHNDHRIHALEHYLLAVIDRADVTSREAHLVQE